METAMIHGLWQLVEMSPASDLVYLGDRELIRLLTSQLVENQNLSDPKAMQEVQSYIGDRLPLIREVARSEW